MTKKTKTTSCISLLLTVIMLLSVLVACNRADGGGNGESTTDTDRGIGIGCIFPPATDYKGHEFTFITEDNSAYDIDFIITDPQDDYLSEAILRRNLLLEEKYNIKVCQKKVSDIFTEVKTQVLGGATQFDVILAPTTQLAMMARNHLLYNLLDIDHFNWEANYWDSNANEQLMIGDKLFFTNGATNIDTIGFCVFFNKKLISKYKLTSPYEFMKNNEWTIDNWAGLVKSVSKDLNNDGVMTEMDQYGSLAEHHNTRMFLYGTGVRATTNDENGYPVLTLMDDAQKTAAVYEKVKNVLSDPSVSHCMTCSTVEPNGYANKWDYFRYLFTQDQFLFHYSTEKAVKQLRDMESEFGIVPFPKYVSNQEKYLTVYPYNNSLIALPAVMENVDRTAKLLEDMNYFSILTVVPKWYDTLLARRYARDDESENNLNLLRSNCVYDLGLYYDFGSMRSIILDADFTTGNIVKSYDKWHKIVNASIQKVCADFQNK